tara:strand:+ start:151 stop:444 length:294 start_codon:yes stop_codon:yes gene_type:complete
MSDEDSRINKQNINLEKPDTKSSDSIVTQDINEKNSAKSSSPKWINNKGEEVKQVFGFNENAELVNARVAMIGFLMLILTELAFAGEPATQKIFGIN